MQALVATAHDDAIATDGGRTEEGEGAILKNRDLMGATNPADAEAGTIRADFADSIDANAVHGSDAADTAANEIGFFFGANGLLANAWPL